MSCSEPPPFDGPPPQPSSIPPPPPCSPRKPHIAIELEDHRHNHAQEPVSESLPPHVPHPSNPTTSNPTEMSCSEPPPFDGPPPQPSSIPPTPPCPPPKPHIALALGNQAQPHPHNHPEEPVSESLPQPAPLNDHPRPHAPHPSNPEWLSLVMSFSFAAMGMAFQSVRPPNHLPLSFHMAGLGLVFALAAFVVSKCVPARLRREAQLLENAGLFFGITAFFLYITILFPLWLKVICWVIYVTAVLAIILSRNFNPRE